MALHADEIEVAQKQCSWGSGAAACEELRAITAHPALHACARPADVAVLEQRHEVVADRAAQCVLKIDHARIALGEHHEIARMVVAMHEHLGLRERRGDQELEGLRKHLPLRILRVNTQVHAAEPFRHQRKLARELRTVVGRKLARGIRPRT